MQTATDSQGHMFYTSVTSDADILLAWASPDEWLTRRQICTRIWRKKSPHIIARIERLVSEHYLTRVTDDTRLGTLWYRPTGKQL